MYQAINVVMDTARRVRWNLFITSLYKWKYKDFLLLFVIDNEQTPTPYNTAFSIGFVMFESQHTVFFPGELQTSNMDLFLLTKMDIPFLNPLLNVYVFLFKR